MSPKGSSKEVVDGKQRKTRRKSMASLEHGIADIIIETHHFSHPTFFIVLCIDLRSQ